MVDYGQLTPQTTPSGQTFYAPSGLLAPPLDPTAGAPAASPMPTDPSQQGWSPPPDVLNLWSQAAGVPFGAQGAPAVGGPSGAPMSPPMGAPPPAMPADNSGPQGTVPLPQPVGTANVGQLQAKQDAIAAAQNTPAALQQQAYQTSLDANGITTKDAMDQADRDKTLAENNNQEQERLIALNNAMTAAKNKEDMRLYAVAQQFHREADDYKIDPSRDFGVGAKTGSLIAAALSGVGLAVMGKGDQPNPVLQMIDQHVKDITAMQMDQRDQLRKKADGADNAADRYDHFSSLPIAQNLAMQSQNTGRFARKLQLSAMQSGSNEAKVRGMQGVAVLKDKQATLMNQAIAVAQDQKNKQIEQANAKAQLGIAGGHLALAQKAEAYNEKHQDDLESIKKELADAKAGGASQAAIDKDIRETGIQDPRTGDQLYSSTKATQQAQQANELAKQADEAQDPAQRQALLNQAGQLRTAASQFAVKVSDAKNLPDVRAKMDEAQTTVDEADELMRGIAKGPGALDRAERQRMGTIYSKMKADAGKVDGARFNEKSQDLLDDQFGPNPSSVIADAKDKSIMMSAIGTYKNLKTNEIAKFLNSNGVRSDVWKPHSIPVNDKGMTSIDEAQQIATPQEVVEGRKQGIGGKAVDWLTGKTLLDAYTGGPGEPASSPAGLDPTQQKLIDATVGRAIKGGPKSDDYQQLLQAATDPRTSFANGVLLTLKDKAPAIYADAISSLPTTPSNDDGTLESAMKDDGVAAPNQASAIGAAPIPALLKLIGTGNQDAVDELARRSAAGDRDAHIALAHIAAIRGR